jgi:hypothetical protein
MLRWKGRRWKDWGRDIYGYASSHTQDKNTNAYSPSRAHSSVHWCFPSLHRSMLEVDVNVSKHTILYRPLDGVLNSSSCLSAWALPWDHLRAKSPWCFTVIQDRLSDSFWFSYQCPESYGSWSMTIRWYTAYSSLWGVVPKCQLLGMDWNPAARELEICLSVFLLWLRKRWCIEYIAETVENVFFFIVP